MDTNAPYTLTPWLRVTDAPAHERCWRRPGDPGMPVAAWVARARVGPRGWRWRVCLGDGRVVKGFEPSRPGVLQRAMRRVDEILKGAVPPAAPTTTTSRRIR